eukprot:881020-Pelagomonas_calceolata.AAC.14
MHGAPWHHAFPCIWFITAICFSYKTGVMESLDARMEVCTWLEYDQHQMKESAHTGICAANQVDNKSP